VTTIEEFAASTKPGLKVTKSVEEFAGPYVPSPALVAITGHVTTVFDEVNTPGEENPQLEGAPEANAKVMAPVPLPPTALICAVCPTVGLAGFALSVRPLWVRNPKVAVDDDEPLMEVD
jgi:hypothetical protein